MSFVSETSRSALGSTQPTVRWVSGLFSAVKRPGRNVDHTPLSSAEIKNEWSCTSIPAMCLDSDNFIVSF